MASINDIPAHLRSDHARQSFKDWLTLQEIDPSAKRRLVKVWLDHFGPRFTAEEYISVGAND